MNKVSIYGNLIVDTVYKVDELDKPNTSNKLLSSYRTIGAAGNVIKSLRALDEEILISINSNISQEDDAAQFAYKELTSLRVDVSELLPKRESATSEAVIISSLKNGQRTSFVNWASCTGMENFSPNINTTWAHFLYLDALENLTPEHLKKFKDEGITVSADLCKSGLSENEKERIFSLLPYIDYLIISDVEAKALIETNSTLKEKSEILGGKQGDGWTIIHSVGGSDSSNGEMYMLKFSDVIKGEEVEVLGAGDCFAASFIYKMINGVSIGKSIEFAHKNTTDNLKKKL